MTPIVTSFDWERIGIANPGPAELFVEEREHLWDTGFDSSIQWDIIRSLLGRINSRPVELINQDGEPFSIAPYRLLLTQANSAPASLPDFGKMVIWDPPPAWHVSVTFIERKTSWRQIWKPNGERIWMTELYKASDFETLYSFAN